ncbi:protein OVEREXPRESSOR OF CATIONIC PEROXIDASE 3 isoform X1 [Punica granatum]|uniref:Protein OVEREXPRESSOR OF CATIONIC PEROXIDASE 3 isoform X1 n=2 Tax=Punica granatum TaxID=22663 RepID=A0A6P8ELG3_PUNGR|nr:protein OVEREXPRESSOR OF CATIONIC PEROXIDASE 3 isoform X1 [Punica granatum]
MAFAPSMSSSFSAQFFSPLSRKRAGLGFNKPCSLILSYPSHTSAVSLSRSPRRQLGLAVCGAKNKKKAKKKQIIHESPDGEDEDLDDDAFESLFKQLEEDLKNDENLSFDDDDLEISEEDFTRLESELKEALGVDDDIEIFGETKDSEQGEDDDDTADQVDDKDDDDDDDEDGETPVELKRWQLRRLASALKAGRRKTSIKTLASELGLDRSIVLELLRDPPPDLLMMSATLPNEPEQTQLVSEPRAVEVVPNEATKDDAEPETKVKAPLHVMHQRWSAQKRLKKVQVQTLENVYRRTKRPTNAIVSSIVQVTSLPRKRIVKWFEDKRAEDGVPDKRTPYQRPVTETASSVSSVHSK